ncbi:ER membrane protein complex subunit 8 [Cimex lectularius]|uniref:MPN domain-containing protein n=1 Tax=Cimex lectularius TaxID=79782 RepID=A0A8I6RFP4_CIMLE|nr:ER membrane protein complex subunit 8 [Cimex lectularius]
MTEVRFTPRAYCKIILHAAKYPHCAINGIMLADADVKESKSKPLVIVDVVPLFHLCLHLTPMAELALTQVDTVSKALGQRMAGYYTANESLHDMSLEKPATKVADKINDIYPPSYVAIIDQRKLTLTVEEPALVLLNCPEGKWEYMDQSSYVVDDECRRVAASLLHRQADKQLVDFDNHLDDFHASWRNLELNEQIDALVQTPDKIE